MAQDGRVALVAEDFRPTEGRLEEAALEDQEAQVGLVGPVALADRMVQVGALRIPTGTRTEPHGGATEARRQEGTRLVADRRVVIRLEAVVDSWMTLMTCQVAAVAAIGLVRFSTGW